MIIESRVCWLRVMYVFSSVFFIVSIEPLAATVAAGDHKSNNFSIVLVIGIGWQRYSQTYFYSTILIFLFNLKFNIVSFWMTAGKRKIHFVYSLDLTILMHPLPLVTLQPMTPKKLQFRPIGLIHQNWGRLWFNTMRRLPILIAWLEWCARN